MGVVLTISLISINAPHLTLQYIQGFLTCNRMRLEILKYRSASSSSSRKCKPRDLSTRLQQWKDYNRNRAVNREISQYRRSSRSLCTSFSLICQKNPFSPKNWTVRLNYPLYTTGWLNSERYAVTTWKRLPPQMWLCSMTPCASLLGNCIRMNNKLLWIRRHLKSDFI